MRRDVLLGFLTAVVLGCGSGGSGDTAGSGGGGNGGNSGATSSGKGVGTGSGTNGAGAGGSSSSSASGSGTGGSGSCCNADANTNCANSGVCVMCLAQNCLSDVVDCSGDTTCDSARKTVVKCLCAAEDANDPSGEQACLATFSSKGQIEANIANCVNGSCSASCL